MTELNPITDPKAVPVTANFNDVENHKVAAKHHEEAAKHHHEAAKSHEAGNHDKANTHTVKAQGHAQIAAEAQKQNGINHAMKS